jgi:hypothetical protein
MSDDERINRACFRLLTDADLAPLVQWWELQLANAMTPPGAVDFGRLAMAQGDRERLTGIKVRAMKHRETEGTTKE